MGHNGQNARACSQSFCAVSDPALKELQCKIIQWIPRALHFLADIPLDTAEWCQSPTFALSATQQSGWGLCTCGHGVYAYEQSPDPLSSTLINKYLFGSRKGIGTSCPGPRPDKFPATSCRLRRTVRASVT